jgi:hypothetical protein
MKIKDCEYKGFKYTILFADRGDWGKHLNHFHTESPHNFTGGFALTLEEVDNNIKQQIDTFINTLPKTIDELLDQLEDQLVWTGYEDCHLDRDTTKRLLQAYISSIMTK